MTLRKALITSLLVLLASAGGVPGHAQTRIKTKTTVTVSHATAVFGEQVTVAANVTLLQPGPLVPAVGIVRFKDITTGELLGSAPLDGAGVARIEVGTLKPGIHTIKGTFHATAGWIPSSGKASLVVRREYVVFGTDQGSLVIVEDARTREEVFRFDAIPGFAGGVSVAATDINEDFIPDILVGAGSGGGSLVSIFDGSTSAPLREFYAFPGFNGPVTVASGELTGDGQPDIVVAASVNGHVKAFDGVTGATIRSFLAFQGSAGPVSVAAGDINDDGTADIILGAPLNGQVKIFDGATTTLLRSFIAYAGYAGGVNVAAADFDGDGVSEVLTGAGSMATHVKAFDAATLALRVSFLAYGGSPYGVRVGAADVNGDGVDDILTTPASPWAHFKIFDGLTLEVLDSVAVGDPPVAAGVFIAGSR